MKSIDLQSIVPLLQENGVQSAGVFGSFIKGKDKPNDIDILIELKEPLGLFKFLELQDKLSQKLNIAVDLVTKKYLSHYFREQVLKEVVMFYGK